MRRERTLENTIVALELQKKKDFFVASWVRLFFAQNFYCTCRNFLKCVLSFFHIFKAMNRIIVIYLRRVWKWANLGYCKSCRPLGHTSSHLNLSSISLQLLYFNANLNILCTFICTCHFFRPFLDWFCSIWLFCLYVAHNILPFLS